MKVSILPARLLTTMLLFFISACSPQPTEPLPAPTLTLTHPPAAALLPTLTSRTKPTAGRATAVPTLAITPLGAPAATWTASPAFTPSLKTDLPAPPGMAYFISDPAAQRCCSEDPLTLQVIGAAGQPYKAARCDALLLNPTSENEDLRLKCRADSVIDLKSQQVIKITRAYVHKDEQWSPDGRYFYSVEWDEQADIFVTDVRTGEKRNLTHTPDRHEQSVRVWKAHPDWLIFASYPYTMEGGEGFMGYLSAIKTDGTQYTLISSQPYDGNAVLSPIGPTILYSDQGGQPAWMYRLGEGSQPFPLQNYGLDGFDQLLRLSPWQWSPGGRYLTGWISGAKDGVYQDKLFVLDWEAGTRTFIDSFKPPYAGGGSSIGPAWSPDERWIHFYASDENGQSGLWIASRDGQALHPIAQLSERYDPCEEAWSPDSQLLAFQCNRPPYDRGIWMVRVGDWQVKKLDLPAEVKFYGWAQSLN